MRLRTALAVAVLFVWAGGVAQAQTEVPLSQLKKVSGEWQPVPDATFRGRSKPAVYQLSRYRVEFALNEDYDWLLFEVGFPDTVETGARDTLFLKVDGEQSQEEITAPQAPKLMRVPVTGKARVVFVSGYGPGSSLCIINPRVVKGTPSAASPSQTGPVKDAPDGKLGPFRPGRVSTSAPAAGVPADFAVDPNDLQKLAEGLRKNVDEDPALKERLATGKIAVATFTLVDIASPAVAQNVAEDLATAMIEKEFRLVERGQLDAVMKELKIQNTGLIDPKSAQEIGKLTGCALILVGSISDRGGFIAVNARLLETQTGDAIAAKRVEMRKIPIDR